MKINSHIILLCIIVLLTLSCTRIKTVKVFGDPQELTPMFDSLQQYYEHNGYRLLVATKYEKPDLLIVCGKKEAKKAGIASFYDSTYLSQHHFKIDYSNHLNKQVITLIADSPNGINKGISHFLQKNNTNN